jgi:hypothetical protein
MRIVRFELLDMAETSSIGRISGLKRLVFERREDCLGGEDASLLIVKAVPKVIAQRDRTHEFGRNGL